MRKILGFLLLFCVWVCFPTVGFSDIVDSDVSVDKNAELLESKIKENELEFDKIVTEAQKRYPDFDWSRFQELKPSARRILVKNLLAQEAFNEIKENYKKDIYNKAKEGVAIDEYDYDTYYYNSSDKLYRTNYVYENIMAEAKKQNLLHPTEGTNWFHFQQQDLPALDKIIANEISKSPADMYCDKECIHPRSETDQDFTQKYLARWKKQLDKYEEEMNEIINNEEDYLKKDQEWYSNFEKENSGIKGSEDLIKEDKERMKKAWDDFEKRKQEIANDIMQRRKEYDEYAKMATEIDVWDLNPYNPDCEMVTISCWNVQNIPTNHERIQLSISKEDGNAQEVIYVYDDFKKNEHVESFAFKGCECNNDINDDYQSVTCDCDLSFSDFVSDFDAYRNYENQDRVDIKNGKMQDRNDDGTMKHEWAGDVIPGGRVYSKSLYLFGSSETQKKINEN